MTAFIIYLLKWAVTLTLLYSLYGLWLRRETFHTLNRAVLLSILLVSVCLPALDVTTEHTTPFSRGMEQLETWAADEEGLMPTADPVPYGASPADSSTDAATTPAPPLSFPWMRLLVLLYWVVTAVFWLRYLYSLIQFGRLIHRAKRIDVAGVPRGVQVLVSQELTNSCSWMRWVVLTPNDLGMEQRAILTHELAHIRRGHSWDKLLCECTCRTLWFLPFAWMLRQDLADVHEFEADRAVLSTGFDLKTYNELIIKKAAHTGLQPVVNAFNESKTKKRMIMMFKKKSTKTTALKVLYLLPLTAFAITVFAKPRPAIDTSLPTTEESLSPTSANPSAALQDNKVVAVLDSTMRAVGARKIGEGIYIGAFRPNFTGDTIRVQTVYLANEQAERIAEHTFTESRKKTYTITLQAEDRKELGRGYHIRWMYPAEGASTQVHVNNKPAH